MLPDRPIQRIVKVLYPELRNSRLLLAVSGGPDSMAMLHFFNKEGYDIIVGHVYYGLRPGESEKEKSLIEKFCKQRNIPFHVLDASGMIHSSESSVQEKAREIRYTWLESIRKKEKCRYILTAHHIDDNAETLLMHLIRGSGLRGMAGIRMTNENIIRPFLLIPKEKLLEYVKNNKVPYSEDSSNRKDDYFRNRVRKHLLSLLKKENPAAAEHLALTALLFSGFQSIWKKEHKNILQKYQRKTENGYRLLLDENNSKEENWFILFESLAPLGFSASQIFNMLLSLYNKNGQEFYSGQYGIKIDGKGIWVFTKNFLYEEFGKYQIMEPESGWPPFIKAGLRKHGSLSFQENEAYLPLEKLIFPLIVRKIKNGDSFIPFGMKGKKKVNDFLKDIGIKGMMKKNVLVLENGDGKIIWVIPYRISDNFRINNKTSRILHLKYVGEEGKNNL
jgi:tRNA(Ile)-lysidine synthase